MAEVRRSIDELVRHATYPRFRTLVAGPHELWVQEFPILEGRRRWLVYSMAGRLIAEVMIDAELELWDVGQDYVLGRRRDEFDRDEIIVYGLNGKSD